MNWQPKFSTLLILLEVPSSGCGIHVTLTLPSSYTFVCAEHCVSSEHNASNTTPVPTETVKLLDKQSWPTCVRIGSARPFLSIGLTKSQALAAEQLTWTEPKSLTIQPELNHCAECHKAVISDTSILLFTWKLSQKKSSFFILVDKATCRLEIRNYTF